MKLLTIFAIIAAGMLMAGCVQTANQPQNLVSESGARNHLQMNPACQDKVLCIEGESGYGGVYSISCVQMTEIQSKKYCGE